MNLVKYWLPALFWAGVIFTFSSMRVYPASEIYWHDFVIKKLAHVIEYSVFYVLVYRAITNTTNVRKMLALWLTFTVVVLYAISDEFHQSFTPGREPKVRDIAIDSTAALGILFAIWKYLPKAPRKLRILAKNLEVLS